MRRAVLAGVAATAFAALAGLVTTAVPATAQSGTIEYLRFDADLRVTADSTVVVTETTVVDFNDVERHGIIRRFPVEYDDQPDDDDRRVLDVDVAAVTRQAGRGGAEAEPYEVSRDGDDLVIRVGDPDVTITGRQRYVVRYTVRGAMNSFPDHEELFWNVTGDTSEQAFRAAAVTVSGPAQIVRARCFVGPVGSTERCGDPLAGLDLDPDTRRRTP